eukprot:99936-Amphidinium_carterae.2
MVREIEGAGLRLSSRQHGYVWSGDIAVFHALCRRVIMVALIVFTKSWPCEQHTGALTLHASGDVA